MGTLTTKLSLYKPEPSDIINVDNDFSSNFETIDKYISFSLCTSTTRPANPYEGLKILEEDTSLLYIYASGQWTPFIDTPPVAVSGGRKAFFKKSSNTNPSTNTTEISAGMSVTFTSEIGRVYWVESYLYAYSDDERIDTLWNLRWAAGNSVSVSGTSINGSRPCRVTTLSPSNSGYIEEFSYIHEFTPNIAGNVTLDWFFKRAVSGTNIKSFSTTSAEYNPIILVRDVGAA